MTKILFTDCDDTLLTTDKKVCEKNQIAIEKLIAQGHKIVLTSGRSLPSTLKQAEALELTFDGCYLISFNGGEIYDIYNKKTIYKSRLPLSIVEQIFQVGEDAGIHVQTYDDKYVLSHHQNEELLRYCHDMKCDYKVVDRVWEFLEDGPSKILLVDYENGPILEELRSKILEMFGDRVDSFFSNPSLMEVVTKGTNKGAAVQILCDYLNVPIENSVSAGDAMNDITMLKAAHVGVAVSNATDAVKEAADYITTLDHNEGAVAEIIEKFILE
jgi:hypothetical protein